MREKLKAFWAKLNTDFATLWGQSKLFVIVFGALILIIKFRTILIDILVRNAKDIFNKSQQEDSALKKEEDAANASANALVQEANKLPDSKPPVGDDWYKNEK